MVENKSDPADNAGDDGPAAFVGEEGGNNRSTPRKDLAAAVVIGILSVVAIALALALPTQGSVYSAPGLLPFLVGASLLFMCVGLGVKAIRAGALRPAAPAPPAADSDGTDHARVAFLIALIIVYVIAVDWITFDLEIPTPFYVINLSSYEVVSTVALAILLKVFWRASLLWCVGVAAVWSVALAVVFRNAFQILLPGSA